MGALYIGTKKKYNNNKIIIINDKVGALVVPIQVAAAKGILQHSIDYSKRWQFMKLPAM